VLDGFGPGKRIQVSRAHSTADLLGRKSQRPLAALDLVAEKFESLSNMNNPCLTHMECCSPS
jgi:hypothetical protein